MAGPEPPRAQTNPLILLGMGVALSLFLMGALTFVAAGAYRASVRDARNILDAKELRGVILHLDEVLTMSARMAAATKDLSWEARYRSYEQKLDSAIKTSVALAPEGLSKMLAEETDEANQALVRMENQSFALVRQGRPGEALALLMGEAYAEQKKVYSAGINNCLQEMERLVRRKADDSRRSVVVFVAAGFAFFLFCWLFIISLLRRYVLKHRQAEQRLRELQRKIVDGY